MLICYNIGKLENARKVLELIKKGVVQFRNKDYSGAIKFYDKALEHDPDNLIALYNKIETLEAIGQYQETVSYCDKILDIKPDFHTAYSKTVEKLKEFVDQTLPFFYEPDLYNDEQDRDFDEISVLYLKANALKHLGRFEDQLVCYDKIHELDPTEFVHQIVKAGMLKQLGMLEDAIKLYDEILKNRSHDRGILLDKADALEEQGQYEKALKCYDEILEFFPLYSSELYCKQKIEKLKNKIL